MHWSKSRHVAYQDCKQKFFFEAIAAPLNPRVEEMRGRPSIFLDRHNYVQQIIAGLLRRGAADGDYLHEMFANTRNQLRADWGSKQSATEQTVIERCVQTFCDKILGGIAQEEILHIPNESDPTEFDYSGLLMQVQPQVVLDRHDYLEVLQFKTGKRRKPEEFKLLAAGWTCWTRKVFAEYERPIVASEYWLQHDGQYHTESFDDVALLSILDEARSVSTEYSSSTRQEDFPARPDIHKCRFCDFKEICSPYRDLAQGSFDLTTLSSGKTAAELQSEVGQYDVFLCHLSEDKAAMVRPFARALDAAGVSYWLDEYGVGWGESIIDSVEDGLSSSRYVICFISEAFLDQGWPKAEMRAMLSEQLETDDTRVLPILSCDPSAFRQKFNLLRDRSYMKWSAGIPTLVSALRKKLSNGQS